MWSLLCTSNNLHFRSKHHNISLAWLRNVFTLFKFICRYITKPTTCVHQMTWTSLTTNFATSQRNSVWNSQLRFEVHDLIDNYVMKLPSFKRTSETIFQKFCELHCNAYNNYNAVFNVLYSVIHVCCMVLVKYTEKKLKQLQNQWYTEMDVLHCIAYHF